jgi:transposase InsO family protein
MNPAYNGNRWILHFLDDFSRMNYVYTMTSKSATLDTVQNFAALVRNQYALTVKVLRLDGESTLQNLFLDWTESNGLVVERSAPYCPQQNGAAE